jgi:nucleoside diphosphate-linked moiety X motif protein 19
LPLYRLAAIRETFEESGVLLIKSSSGSSNQSEAFSFHGSCSLSSWRKQVHSSPDQLLSLYREVGAVPDLWAVKEWSDWLTPTDLNDKGKRRFDTIFYTACLDSIPATMLDQAEVTAVQWTDPASLLHKFYEREFWLAPPQVYELSRLLNFRDQQDLAQFSAIRHQAGLTTWLPVRMECDDGMLSILPGDSLYPDSPDYAGTSGKKPGPYQGTLDESRAACEQLNRLEFRDTYDCVTRVKGDSMLHGHVLS